MQKEKTLVRLTRLRQMEEEMSRLDLEAAVAERARIFQRWQTEANTRASGRSSFGRSVEKDDCAARQDSLVTMEQARRRQESLAPVLNAADLAIEQLRAQFFARRTATRQAETLMQEERAGRRADEEKRLQQMLDDWFGHRNRRIADASERQNKRQGERLSRVSEAEEPSNG